MAGFGPETSADFYTSVTHKVEKMSGTTRPAINMASPKMDLARERNFIDGGQEGQYYLMLLKELVKKLEAVDSDFLALPCNSLHDFIEVLRRETSLPILSIVEETVSYLVRQGVTKVGLLATTTTLNQGLYFKQLQAAGIEFIAPEPSNQIVLNETISRIINNETSDEDRAFLEDMVANLTIEGIQAIVLACTDLHLLMPDALVPVFDTMEILAESAAREILKDE